MIRIGVFGAGYWGPITEAMARWLPEVVVDRVWSRRDQRSAELAAKVGCRAAEAIDDVENLDLAVAALPPVAIPTVASACLERGVRCLLEKPVCLDAAEIRALDARFEEQGLAAAVNLQGRFVPAMHPVRHAVVSGQFGRLAEVDVRRWVTVAPPPRRSRTPG